MQSNLVLIFLVCLNAHNPASTTHMQFRFQDLEAYRSEIPVLMLEALLCNCRKELFDQPYKKTIFIESKVS